MYVHTCYQYTLTHKNIQITYQVHTWNSLKERPHKQPFLGALVCIPHLLSMSPTYQQLHLNICNNPLRCSYIQVAVGNVNQIWLRFCGNIQTALFRIHFCQKQSSRKHTLINFSIKSFVKHRSTSLVTTRLDCNRDTSQPQHRQI